MIEIPGSLRLDTCEWECQMFAPTLLSKSKAVLIHFSVEGRCLISAQDRATVASSFLKWTMSPLFSSCYSTKWGPGLDSGEGRWVMVRSTAEQPWCSWPFLQWMLHQECLSPDSFAGHHVTSSYLQGMKEMQQPRHHVLPVGWHLHYEPNAVIATSLRVCGTRHGRGCNAPKKKIQLHRPHPHAMWPRHRLLC